MVDRVSAAFEKLTPREREILRLIAAHLQSKEIARALGLSPKTVEMHVLSARRRLSGLSRRDAALAFVAWEAGRPGNDYRKQSGGLVALPDPPLSGRETGNDDDRAAAATAEPVQSREGRGPRPWRTALQDFVSGPGDLPVVRRDWRHELSHIQWLGLILAIAAGTSVLLAISVASLHEFVRALERIMAR